MLAGYQSTIDDFVPILKKKLHSIEKVSLKVPLSFYFELETGAQVGKKYSVKVRKKLEEGTV